MAIASSSSSNVGDGQDRPEDLLARDPHRVGDAIEDRRRDVAAAALLADALATGDEPGPFRLPELDVAEHLRELAARRPWTRACVRGSSGSPGRQLPPERRRSARPAPRGPSDGRRAASRHCRSGRCCRRSPSRSWRPPPRGRRRRPRTTCGLLPPSSSEIALTSVSPIARRSDRPTSVEPVNAILSTAGWRARASPMTPPGPLTTLRTPSGSPASAASSASRSARQRRLARGLEHDRVARRERRPELPGGDDQRVVPGHDRGDHADRLAGDERQRVRSGRADLAVDLVDRLRVPLEGRGGARDVHPERVADRLADVERLEQRQLVEVLADELRQPQQDALARGRRLVRPAPVVERPAGGRHRAVDVLGVALGDRRDPRPVATGDVVERPARRRPARSGRR